MINPEPKDTVSTKGWEASVEGKAGVILKILVWRHKCKLVGKESLHQVELAR
jgi:hypothetical protein